MELIQPHTLDELAGVLAEAAAAGRTINLGGQFSKNRMGGPVRQPEVIVSTNRMARVLEYEPKDLTISVEAGMPFAELTRVLAEHDQMVPLDPVYAAQATVGGVLAANTCGPRRRLYGSARDSVIGMKFATLEGRVVQTGGMVVKNVAGLDMAKLIIGSFGTLAAIGVVNFKLYPVPPGSRSFVLRAASLDEAAERRKAILGSVLQPAAIDLVNPQAASRLGREGWLLLLQYSGSEVVLERAKRELQGAEVVSGTAESELWDRVREFAPEFMTSHPDGAVLRLSRALKDVAVAMRELDVPSIARAGTGVCYACFEDCHQAAAWMRAAIHRNYKAVYEFAPEQRKPELDLWPAPGGDLELMKRIKHMFDPRNLLNQGRLYGRI